MLRRLALFLLCCSLFSVAQIKRPFTFEDMMQLKRIGEPSVSPDGKWVAFSAVDVDLDANSKTPHLWIVPLAGGDAKRLTPASGSGEDRVRFSPDGQADSVRVGERWKLADLGAALRRCERENSRAKRRRSLASQPKLPAEPGRLTERASCSSRRSIPIATTTPATSSATKTRPSRR